MCCCWCCSFLYTAVCSMLKFIVIIGIGIPFAFIVGGLLGAFLSTNSDEVTDRIEGFLNESKIGDIAEATADKLTKAIFGYSYIDIVNNDTLKSRMFSKIKASKMDILNKIWVLYMDSDARDREIIGLSLLPEKFRNSFAIWGSIFLISYVGLVGLYYFGCLFCCALCKCGKKINKAVVNTKKKLERNTKRKNNEMKELINNKLKINATEVREKTKNNPQKKFENSEAEKSKSQDGDIVSTIPEKESTTN